MCTERIINQNLQDKIDEEKKKSRLLLENNKKVSIVDKMQIKKIDYFYFKIKTLIQKINFVLYLFKITDEIPHLDSNIEEGIIEHINNCFFSLIENLNIKIKKTRFLINSFNDKIYAVKKNIKQSKKEIYLKKILFFASLPKIVSSNRNFIKTISPLIENEKENKKFIKIKKYQKIDNKNEKKEKQNVVSFFCLTIIKKISMKIRMNLILQKIDYGDLEKYFEMEKEMKIDFISLLKYFLKYPFFLGPKDALKLSNYIMIENDLQKNINDKKFIKNEISYIQFISIFKNLINSYLISNFDSLEDKITPFKKVQ